jgi:hypothetical protein
MTLYRRALVPALFATSLAVAAAAVACSASPRACAQSVPVAATDPASSADPTLEQGPAPSARPSVEPTSSSRLTIPPSWDSVLVGGPAPVDTVDRHNVIHTREGRTVEPDLPSGADILQLQRVRDGWVIAYRDGIRRFGFLSTSGALRKEEGPFGQDMLGVSPDGTLIAVRQASDRVDVHALPSYAILGTLRTDGMAVKLGEAHFVGDGAVLVNSGRIGDAGGPDLALGAFNWRTGGRTIRENLSAVSTFDSLAVIASDAPTVDLVRVEPTLTLRAVGCLPSGAWRPSPDRKWLAAPCWEGDCVMLVPLPDLLAGRAPEVRDVPVPVSAPVRGVFFADNDDVMVALELSRTHVPYEDDAVEHGLLRCPIAAPCTRATFPEGLTTAVIDIGLIRT